jgi:hypothetical protein
LNTSRISLISGDVEIPGQHNSFSRCSEVSDSSIKGLDEPMTEVIPRPTAVCRAVNANEDKRRELEHQAAAFSIEGWRINANIDQLTVGRVSTDGLLGRLITVPNRGAWGAEHAENAFLGSNRCTDRLTCVYSDARVTYLQSVSTLNLGYD